MKPETRTALPWLTAALIGILFLMFGCECKTKPCAPDAHLQELRDSIHKLNEEVFWLRDANNLKGSGIYRFAHSSWVSQQGHTAESVIFEIMDMGFNASPYREMECLWTDSIYGGLFESK